MYEELRRVNQRLAGKVFQLHGLFDISRELTTSLDEDSIMGLMGTTLMGQLTTSRFALYLAPDGEGLRLAHERGFRSGESGEPGARGRKRAPCSSRSGAPRGWSGCRRVPSRIA